MRSPSTGVFCLTLKENIPIDELAPVVSGTQGLGPPYPLVVLAPLMTCNQPPAVPDEIGVYTYGVPADGGPLAFSSNLAFTLAVP